MQVLTVDSSGVDGGQPGCCVVDRIAQLTFCVCQRGRNRLNCDIEPPFCQEHRRLCKPFCSRVGVHPQDGRDSLVGTIDAIEWIPRYGAVRRGGEADIAKEQKGRYGQRDMARPPPEPPSVDSAGVRCGALLCEESLAVIA